jgi:hypothetical protein
MQVLLHPGMTMHIEHSAFSIEAAEALEKKQLLLLLH